MNYVLKNEQLFIELCRGPDYNWESGVAILFRIYLGSDKPKVLYYQGSTVISFQFRSHRVGNVFIRKIRWSPQSAGGIRMRTLTDKLYVDPNSRVFDATSIPSLGATWREGSD